MKTLLCLTVILPALLLLSGCAHRSYHPWLGEEHLVDDDRVAGVWQGIDSSGNDDDETELFFIRRVEELPELKEKGDSEDEVPEGYYAVSWIDNESIEEPASPQNLTIRPKKLFAGLYRIDSVLLVQVWGSTVDGNPLVAPMHVIYKARLEGDLLFLHDLELDDMNEANLIAEGLLFESNKENPIVFFSPTETLTKFIRKHLDEEGFFTEKPSLTLRRLRDLSLPVIDDQWEGDSVEELEPVP